DALNETIKDDDGPMILLEGMSGKGSEIGRNFDEIAQIIQGVSHIKSGDLYRYLSSSFCGL
ncbi:hypothetical protein LEA_11758, partial [human gut metagenome]